MTTDYRAAITAVQQYLHGHSLEAFRAEHGIKGKSDGKHLILAYDQIAHEKDKSLWARPYGHVCRGLILDAETHALIAFGLPKFFNVGEPTAHDLDWSTARVVEKLDGTMVQRWWSPRTERFEYSTKFQLPGELETNTVEGGVITWAALIARCLPAHETQYQQKHDTYVYEILSPANPIVVRHTEDTAVILAVRHLPTMNELNIGHVNLGPKSFALASRADVEAFANTLNGTESEGFVVLDAAFRRVKIKGSDYLRLHRLRNQTSVRRLIELVHAVDTEEVLSYFPAIRPKVEVIEAVVDAIQIEHELAYDKLWGINNQKEFAIALTAMNLPAPWLLFNVRSGKAKTIQEALYGADVNRFVKLVKPLVALHGLDTEAEVVTE